MQAVADRGLAGIIRQVLLVKLDGFFGRDRFAVHQLRAHHVRVSPNSRSTDVDGVRRHFPVFRAAALDSLWFAHAGRKFSRGFSVPQTTALTPLSSANRMITSVACSASLLAKAEPSGSAWPRRPGGNLNLERDLLYLNSQRGFSSQISNV